MSDLADLRGIPGITTTTLAVVDQVRNYVRDYPQLNRLIGGEESSDRQILWALLDATALFNVTPPPTSMMLEELLQANCLPILIRLTTISLLEGVGMLQTRNHINYSNGGINVGVSDKTPLIMQWLQYLRTTVDQLLKQVKISMNIMSILGADKPGVSSEYWAVHNTYSYW